MSSQITAPLPGIFYRRPAPNKDAFVEVGEQVEAGQTIGLIEIMKQFTEIRSESAGVLTSYEVEDYGTVGPGDVIATIG